MTTTTPVTAYAAAGIKHNDLMSLRIAHIRAAPQCEYDKVFNFLCEYFGRDKEKVLSKSRKADLVYIRQIFCYACHTYFKSTLKAIGNYLNGRDHTTILHNVRTLEGLMETELETRLQVQLILSKII